MLQPLPSVGKTCTVTSANLPSTWPGDWLRKFCFLCKPRPPLQHFQFNSVNEHFQGYCFLYSVPSSRGTSAVSLAVADSPCMKMTQITTTFWTIHRDWSRVRRRTPRCRTWRSIWAGPSASTACRRSCWTEDVRQSPSSASCLPSSSSSPSSPTVSCAWSSLSRRWGPAPMRC